MTHHLLVHYGNPCVKTIIHAIIAGNGGAFAYGAEGLILGPKQQEITGTIDDFLFEDEEGAIEAMEALVQLPSVVHLDLIEDSALVIDNYFEAEGASWDRYEEREEAN